MKKGQQRPRCSWIHGDVCHYPLLIMFLLTSLFFIKQIDVDHLPPPYRSLSLPLLSPSFLSLTS